MADLTEMTLLINLIKITKFGHDQIKPIAVKTGSTAQLIKNLYDRTAQSFNGRFSNNTNVMEKHIIGV